MDKAKQERRKGRPSLLTVVSAAAVGYGAYRLASWAWDKYSGRNEEEEHDVKHEELSVSFSYLSRPSAMPSVPDAQSRSTLGHQGMNQEQKGRLRRQRMSRCREEALKALDGFLPTLRKVIEDQTSTKEATQKLKKLRANRLNISQDSGEQNPYHRNKEQEIWNSIQIRLITRMMATAYAHSILFLVLTVQVNLLGGRLLGEQLKSGSSQMSGTSSTLAAESVTSSRMDSYQSSHRFVLLHTYEYFFEKGLVFLIKIVERAVTKSLADDWNVLDRTSLHLTRDQMEEKITAMRIVMESGGNSRKEVSILRFLMPPSAHLKTAMEDELASSILDETWDLLESPVMKDAEKDCLSTTFDMMRDNHWGNLFVTSSQDGTARYVSKPLASVIPQLKHTANSFFKQPNESFEGRDLLTVNSYCSMMQALPTVLELSDVSFN